MKAYSRDARRNTLVGDPRGWLITGHVKQLQPFKWTESQPTDVSTKSLKTTRERIGGRFRTNAAVDCFFFYLKCMGPEVF